MANKSQSIKVFENWAGVDYSKSDLVRQPNVLANAKNYYFGNGGSIVGRRGFQVVGQKGKFRSGHTYSYLDRTSGETMEEVLAANNFLWRLKTASFTITPTVAVVNYGYTLAVSGSQYVFSLYILSNPGPSQGVSSFNLGLGTEDVPYTIAQLIVDVDALATMTSSNPAGIPYAKVNGNQTSSTVLTVDAGHTISVGDFLQFYNHDPSDPGLVARKVTAKTATTVSFTNFGSVTVKDDQILGPLASPAASIRSTTGNVQTSSPMNIEFYYWEPVDFNFSSGYATWPLEFSWQTTDPKPHSYVNANDVCYIGSTKRDLFIRAQLDGDPDGKLLKYDGVRIYRAGLPQASISSVTPTGGALTYRYIATYETMDAQGNIVEGRESSITTTTSAALSISVVVNSLQQATSNAWFNIVQAQANGAQAGVTTGVTVDSGHGIKAGDIVSIYDSITSALVRRKITSVTATTLVWDATTAINVPDNVFISPTTIKIWRTKVNGADFYLVNQACNDASSSTVTFTDNMADASLVIKYEFPEEGQEHDLPPCMNYLCLHQGALVGAGDREQPNTVVYSIPGFLEYFPRGTNSIDIPSTVRGPITAIGSDSSSRLAVFKSTCYYDVEGYLDTGGLAVNVINERDYGVISHSSLVKLRSQLLGFGLLGPIVVKDGQMTTSISEPIVPIFRRDNVIGTITGAHAINDASKGIIRAWVNDAGTVIQGFAGDYQDGLAWFPWDYSSEVRPVNGMTVSSTDLYNISDSVFREINLTESDNALPSDHYHDNCSAIDYKLKTTALCNDAPKIIKTWRRLALYSYDSSFEDDYVAFTTTVKTYRNRGSVAHTSTSKTFSGGESAFVQEVNLKDNQAQHLSIELETNTVGQRPMWNGFEVLVRQPTSDEEMSE